MRKTNIKQKQDRMNAFLNLIDTHPEAITLNVRKLVKEAGLSSSSYQILNRTWYDMKDTIKFKRVNYKQAQANAD